MADYQEIIRRHTKRQKTQLEETKQASKPDANMAGMFDLSGQKF